MIKAPRRSGEEKEVKTELVQYFTHFDSRVVLKAATAVNLALTFLLTALFFGEVNWEVKQ